MHVCYSRKLKIQSHYNTQIKYSQSCDELFWSSGSVPLAPNKAVTQAVTT